MGGLSGQQKVYTVGVVVLFALICVSIVFEEMQEYLVEHTGQNFKPVLASLFSELTVLGFVSLCMFVTLKVPYIEELSEQLFHEPEQVAEISETLHMVLFLVMVVHISQVCFLVLASGTGARRLKDLEADCVDIETITEEYVAEQRELKALSGKDKYVKTLQLEMMPQAEARLQYASIRHEFTSARERLEDDNKDIVPLESTPNFNFAEYLLILEGLTTAELIEVPVSSWLGLQLILVTFWVYLIEFDKTSPLTHETVVIGCELVILFFVLLTYHKMKLVKRSITPRALFHHAERMLNEKDSVKSSPHQHHHRHHSGEKDMELGRMNSLTTTSFNADATDEASKLVPKRESVTSYYSRAKLQSYTYDPADNSEEEQISEEEHEELFWFKESELVPWILRLCLLTQAICVSVSWCLLRKLEGGYFEAIKLLLFCTLLPGLCVAYVLPIVVEDYVINTTIAPFKRPLTIAQVVRRQKLIRSFRSLQLGAIMMQYEENTTPSGDDDDDDDEGAAPSAAKPVLKRKSSGIASGVAVSDARTLAKLTNKLKNTNGDESTINAHLSELLEWSTATKLPDDDLTPVPLASKIAGHSFDDRFDDSASSTPVGTPLGSSKDTPTGTPTTMKATAKLEAFFNKTPIERRILYRHEIGWMMAQKRKPPSDPDDFDRVVLALQAASLFVGIQGDTLEKAAKSATYRAYAPGTLINGTDLRRPGEFIALIIDGQILLGGGNGAVELPASKARGDLELCNELDLLEAPAIPNKAKNWMSCRADPAWPGPVLLCEIEIAVLREALDPSETQLLNERLIKISVENHKSFISQCQVSIGHERFSILNNFEPHELAELASIMWRFDYMSEEFVARDEERATMVYLVAQQSLSISLGSRKHAQILGEIHVGGIMGESILKTPAAASSSDAAPSVHIQKRTADVVAATDDTVLFAIPKEACDPFREKILQNARVELARRQKANEALKQKHQDQIKQKIASLKPEQHLEQLALFRVFDKDGDGTISREEIDDFLNKVGFALKSESSVKAIQKSIHAFGDTINFQSFAAWILKQQEQAAARMKAEGGISSIHSMMFDIIDQDLSGEITLHELQTFMNTIGESFSLDELQSVLLESDSSGDGKLDREEFATLLTQVGIS